MLFDVYLRCHHAIQKYHYVLFSRFFSVSPLRDCHLIVVRGFACLSDPKSYTSRSLVYRWDTQVGQVLG